MNSTLNNISNQTDTTWSGSWENVGHSESLRVTVVTTGSGVLKISFSPTADANDITNTETKRIKDYDTLHVPVHNTYFMVEYFSVNNTTFTIQSYKCTGYKAPFHTGETYGDTSGGVYSLTTSGQLFGANDRTSDIDRKYSEVAVYGTCTSATTLTVQCTHDSTTYYDTLNSVTVPLNEDFYIDVTSMAPRYLALKTSNPTRITAFVARK